MSDDKMAQDPMEFMRKSLETDIRHGHHASMPPRTAAAAADRAIRYARSVQRALEKG